MDFIICTAKWKAAEFSKSLMSVPPREKLEVIHHPPWLVPVPEEDVEVLAEGAR